MNRIVYILLNSYLQLSVTGRANFCNFSMLLKCFVFVLNLVAVVRDSTMSLIRFFVVCRWGFALWLGCFVCCVASVFLVFVTCFPFRFVWLFFCFVCFVVYALCRVFLSVVACCFCEGGLFVFCANRLLVSFVVYCCCCVQWRVVVVLCFVVVFILFVWFCGLVCNSIRRFFLMAANTHENLDPIHT